MNKSYTSLFIEIGKYAGLTMLIIGGLVTTAAMASSSKLQETAETPLQTTNAQLTIQSPNMNICPASAKIGGFIHTSKPGKVSYMLAEKDGDVTGPFSVEAVKSVHGGMASFSKALKIT